MTEYDNRRTGCGCGIGTFGVGSVVAMIISYTANGSIGWMLVHGFFGWFYVIIYVIRHGFGF